MTTGFAHETNTTTPNVDWWTPEWVFPELGLEYDLDPAAPEGGVPWIPAARVYSPVEDGLAQPWAGRVWLNPPYGKGTPAWLKRMHDHRNGVALVFARTDCAWFHDYAAEADAILFLRGRIQFVDARSRTAQSGAGAGSMLIAWGQDNVAAVERMADRGLFVSLAERRHS